MSNFNDFSRVGEKSFAFHVNRNDEDKLNILIKSRIKNSKLDKSRKIINLIANQLSSNEKLLDSKDDIYYKYKNKIFKLESVGKSLLSSLLSSMLSSITFIKNTKNTNIKEYNLKEYNLTEAFIKKGKIIDLDQLEKSQNYLDIPESFPLESTKDLPSILKSNSFSDPYTVLSTSAFQKFEENYDSKDINKKKLKKPGFILVETDSGVLKLEKGTRKVEGEANEKTVQNYRQFLFKMYGEDKIAYIEKCYGISLKEMINKKQPLTPEIVYRINIGLSNTEIQDIHLIFGKMKELKNNLNNVIYEKENSALSFLEDKKNCSFSLFEIKGLYRQFSPNIENPTIEDLKNWVDKFELPDSFEEMSRKQFNSLFNLISVKEEERENQYTGRKIYHPIQSAYTTAGVKIFKPWIDQQELVQIFPQLQSLDWDHYYEKLCHVVCKKHLVRVHPSETYRIGALIPAPNDPNDPNGEARWYKVTQFVNNGKGLVSYTLEPACKDDTLPAIKLYRSTSSDPYAMDGEESVKNDINPLNPPGYEGSHLSEKYEEGFFKERTIPTWVAYQHQAHSQIDEMLNKKTYPSTSLSSAFENLKLATKEFQKTRLNQEGDLKLAALVKKYDAELNILLKQAAKHSKISTRELKKLMKILTKKNKKGEELSPQFLKKQKKNAEFILKILNRLPDSKEKNLILKFLNDEIIRASLDDTSERIELKGISNSKDLEGYIISSESKSQDSSEEFVFKKISDSLDLEEKDENIFLSESKNEELTEKFKDLDKEENFLDLSESKKEGLDLNELLNYEIQFENLKSSSGDHDAEMFKLLRAWNNKLFNHAKFLKEDIGSKKFQEIVFAGHSLGGASAQRGLVQFLIEKNRVPLPGCSASLRLFDEPGILFSDNEAFKDFGNSHVELLNKQKSKFNITRRQETGDFVVTGGEVHLGATYSSEEDQKILRWMKFDACVQGAHAETTDRTISFSKTAHATQFQTGKRQSEWIFEDSKKILKSSKKNKEKVSSEDDRIEDFQIKERKKVNVEQIEKIKQKSSGDFKRTWYSPSTQGVFDMGKQSKDWKNVKDIWNLSFIESVGGEKLRKTAGKVLRTEYTIFGNLRMFKSNPELKESLLHGEWRKHRDENGVFVVNEQGISSDFSSNSR